MKKRNLLLILFIAILAVACSNNGKTEQKESNQSAVTTNAEDNSITKSLQTWWRNTKYHGML
ncbi:hypothetical protein [Bacteroides propionicifaciens]|uniref:hypothetical protein n=1 Tax=Bacteroides propionicifaciens TaxID=392838 RepID=UPI0003A2E234|nr:hypothetical protein [Bacteroides propionicifaciens]